MNTSTCSKNLFAGLLGLILCAPGLAFAQFRLGYEGNVGLGNPHPETQNQYFGSGVAAGDFDGNGIGDLVILENTSSRMRVLRGGNWSVGQMGPVIKFLPLSVATPGHNGIVATGDFDGDGRDEIALGYPAASRDGWYEVGRVAIMDRDAGGAWYTQETIRIGLDGYTGVAAETDRLGGALASGDFDNDGYDDLAIGARTRTLLGIEDAGSVLVVYGSSSGIGPARSKLFSRYNDGQGVTPEEDDNFGVALAVADFTGDGPQDLAIGISNARCPNGIRGGGVVILRGSINGLVNVQSRSYFAGVDGTPGTCTDNRRFGKALATGRFNDDARPDLAIGAGGSIEEHGSVTVLASSITGPGPNASRYFRGSDLPMPPISDSARVGDILATGPLLGPNDLDSLAMGVPYDAVDGSVQSGSVRIVHPSPNGAGLSLAGAERWIQRAPLVLSPPASRDDFGAAIAITDLNGDSLSDIAIGLRNRDGDETNSGAVQVIYQGEFLFRDGFED